MARFWTQALSYWFSLPQWFRFICVGGYNTVFAYGIFALFYFILHKILSTSIILLFSYLLGFLNNWLVFRFFVFQSHINWKQELWKIALIYLGTYIINIFLLKLFLLFSPIYLAQALCNIFIPIITYFTLKFFAFS